MHDLAEQIDAGIPGAPAATTDLDALLREGRGALRRRRLAAGAGAVAVAVTVGGTAWALSPGGRPATAPADDRFADGPGAAADPWTTDEAPAVYDPDTGELLIRDGWTVVDRVEDPITGPASSDFGAEEIDDSVGLVLTNGSEERWILTWYSDDPTPHDPTTDGTGASGASSGVPGEEFDSFPRWLDHRSALLLSEPEGDVWGPDAAMYDPDEGLVVKPGWQVAERIDEVAGPDTLAVDLVRADDPQRRQWFLFSERMTIGSRHAPAPGYPTFQSWVEVNAPLLPGRGSDGGPAPGSGDWPGVERDDLVSFPPPTTSSVEPWTLMPLDGVTIVEQRARPDLPESFAAPEDVSAVALVEADGERWFVLARDLPGDPPQYIAVPADGQTLDEFLDFARQRYAEGGGGVL